MRTEIPIRERKRVGRPGVYEAARLRGAHFNCRRPEVSDPLGYLPTAGCFSTRCIAPAFLAVAEYLVKYLVKHRVEHPVAQAIPLVSLHRSARIATIPNCSS
jgi:hypothetical protein